jgi:hypothetical protein
VPPAELAAPAVAPAPGLAVAPVDPALEVLDPPEPIRAFVNMNWPDLDVLLALAPAVPLVPVAPAVLPPCRQPVTVTVRLELDV